METNSEEGGSGRGYSEGVETRANLYMCVRVFCWGFFFFYCRRISPSLDLQVDVLTSSKCPTRQQVRTQAVKIAAARPIAVISEACLSPDRNTALSRK